MNIVLLLIYLGLTVALGKPIHFRYEWAHMFPIVTASSAAVVSGVMLKGLINATELREIKRQFFRILIGIGAALAAAWLSLKFSFDILGFNVDGWQWAGLGFAVGVGSKIKTILSIL